MKKQIRTLLLSLGFDRATFSRDHGDGMYEEIWTNGTDKIVLSWKGVNLARIGQNENEFGRKEKCEKCNRITRYRVKIMGARWAAWCGCGN